MLIAFLLFIKESPAIDTPDPVDKNIPNVIIIILSGVRNSESITDPDHQYIPNLWNNMRKEGALYTNLVCLGAEFHVQAAAINTGRSWSAFCRIDTPTIFQYIRKKYTLPLHSLWSIGQLWGPLCHYNSSGYGDDTYPSELAQNLILTPELEVTFTKQESFFLSHVKENRKHFPGFTAYIWDAINEVDYRFFKKIIREFKPKMVQFVMQGTETAHYDTFARYALSLKRSDEMIFEIWQMIKNDPFYKNNTYLIVCPDHGRNLYYMQHNENAHDDPSHVWMYIYGPHIKKGITISRSVYHRDIFVTLAYIMDVETHPSEGKVLKDCFLYSKIK